MMIKKSITNLLLLACSLLFIQTSFAKVVKGKGDVGRTALATAQSDGVNRTLVNIGQVSMWIFADATSAVTPGGSSGLEFPRGFSPSTSAIFQDGFIYGGLVNDGGSPTLRVGGQTYSNGLRPGAILGTRTGERESETNAGVDRVWRIRRDFNTADLTLDAQELSSSVAAVRAQYESDWRDWPAHKGAPFLDADSDGVYTPEIGGDGAPVLFPDADEPGFADADQVIWLVANDVDRGTITGLYGSPPIGLELQVTLWAYRRADALGNIIFKQFRLIYKGTDTTPAGATIDSMYTCQWSDPDLGGAGDDLAGSDTTESFIYAYNGSSQDAVYAAVGLPPPASGYDFFAGPLVRAAGEEAIFGLQKRAGWRNLPMTTASFFSAGGDQSDPPRAGDYNGTRQWWNLLRGFKGTPESPSEPWTHDDGSVTMFRVPGDPVTGEGFIDSVPGDRRILAASGPFTMAVGDTQETVVSVIAALGSDRLSSISVLRFFDKFAQEAFDNLFDLPKPQPTPQVEAAELDKKIILNWGRLSDKIAETEETSLKGYAFQGYNVYQLPSLGASLDQATKLATFDVVDEITTISQPSFDPPSGQILRLPVQFGTNNGISRTLTITRDEIREVALSNGQEYFFGVTAYSFNGTPGLTAASLESPLGVVRVVPQGNKPGERHTAAAGDFLTLNHEGDADGIVSVEVVDPDAFVTGDYTLEFISDTTVIDDSTFTTATTWDVTLNGQSVFPAQQTNFVTSGAGNNDQTNFNGLLVRAGSASFDKPITFFDTEFTDADPSDAGLSLWGDGLLFGLPDGSNLLFWGGGTTELALLQKDIELRFTGVLGADGSIVSGGQMGTLGGVSGGSGGRDIDAHPFRPADAPATGSFLQRIPFEAWDVDDPANPRQINIAFYDRGADGSRDAGSVAYHRTWNIDGRDYLTFIVSDYDETAIHELTDPNATWVAFFHQGGADSWTTGDVFKIIYANPVVPGLDKWKFSTTAKSASNQVAKSDVADRVGVFPNPYYGFNSRELNRFERFITFSNLPEKAIIRVFNLGGILVKTLDKERLNNPSQFVQWDLKNESGLPVASGIYVVNIQFPDLGSSKNLKLALIQEAQFLRNF